MKKLPAAVAVAATVLVTLAIVGPGAGATTAAKGGNNPVKLTGKVNVAGTGTATNGAVAIQATDFAFNPTFVKVPAGATSVTVNLTNTGTHEHTFTMPSQNVDQVSEPRPVGHRHRHRAQVRRADVLLPVPPPARHAGRLLHEEGRQAGLEASAPVPAPVSRRPPRSRPARAARAGTGTDRPPPGRSRGPGVRPTPGRSPGPFSVSFPV